MCFNSSCLVLDNHVHFKELIFFDRFCTRFRAVLYTIIDPMYTILFPSFKHNFKRSSGFR
jgi:hypothetical protein